jgi:GDSL-like lipase/acylhydrolase family protein
MWRNFLIGAAIAACILGLLEGALRLSGQVPTNALRSPDIETLNSIPGMFEPEQDFDDLIRPDLPYHVHINSLGFRGHEFLENKETGSIRVLCLGDSYTFGHHVDDDEAFPAVLNKMLREIPPPGAEAINAGANGFTIVDETTFLKEKGLALHPDVVVLVFSQNDIEDLARPEPMIESMRDHAELKSVFVLGPILKLLQHTAIFNGMQRTAAWLIVREKRQAVEAAQASEREAARQAELWTAYREKLVEAHGLLAERGIRMLLVAWPSAEQVAGSSPTSPERTLEEYARDLGVEYLDLTPAMSQLRASGTNPYLVPLDGHPSWQGHQAAAAAIRARLDGLGWLTPRLAGSPGPSPEAHATAPEARPATAP